jgi:phospholipase C
VKLDKLVDGHPGGSKVDQFEAIIDNILDRLKAKREQLVETAFLVTFDEGVGYWDTGFVQTLDFLRCPRVPLIAISPYSRGGRVVHSYDDRASVVKFIERDWASSRLAAAAEINCPIRSRITTITFRKTFRRSAICSTCSISTTCAESASRFRFAGTQSRHE